MAQSKQSTKPKGRSYGLWCSACFVVLVAAVAAPLALKYNSLKPGQPFALATTHNGTVNPVNRHSRFRGADYKTSKQFFQWWNFLVYDAKTNNHFTIIYNIERPPQGSKLPAAASVAIVHYSGSKYQTSATEKFPLRLLDITDDFNLRYKNEREGKIPHTLTAVSDSEYHITADFPKGISFDLKLHRVHGFYGSEDAEQGNIDGVCAMLSTLFSYDSEVEGTITIGNKEYTFVRDPRFRSYAAGSWGCNMPKPGPEADPVDYPWSWMWLVVPHKEPAHDISMVFGTGTFDFGFPIGVVDGGYGTVAVGDLPISGRYAQLFHNTSFELPMQASASDNILVNLEVQRSEWTTFEDHLGKARIPLRQVFIMETDQYLVSVDFHSKVEQYFRLPATLVNDDGSTTVFSDFRACGVETHIEVTQLDTARHEPEVTPSRRRLAPAQKLVDQWITTMNAVEFAYSAPLDEELLQKFFEEEQLQYR